MATLTIPRNKLQTGLDAAYADACARLEAQTTASPGDKALRRWANALARAWVWIEAQEALTFTKLATDPALVVPSTSTPGTTYEANGVCSCQAHANGQPCWHRAASRLARTALAQTLDAALAVETPEQAQARQREAAIARSTAATVQRVIEINAHRRLQPPE